jgi:hypothetical protein
LPKPEVDERLLGAAPATYLAVFWRLDHETECCENLPSKDVPELGRASLTKPSIVIKPSSGLEPETPSLPWARDGGCLRVVCGFLPLTWASRHRLRVAAGRVPATEASIKLPVRTATETAALLPFARCDGDANGVGRCCISSRAGASAIYAETTASARTEQRAGQNRWAQTLAMIEAMERLRARSAVGRRLEPDHCCSRLL